MSSLDRLDKSVVLEACIAALEGRIRKTAAQARASADSAAGEEDGADASAAEGYLARGQAVRVAELQAERDALAAMRLRDGEAVGVGSLVALEDEDGEGRVVFLAPVAGGLSVTVGRVDVQVVTPSSPLGKELVGLRADDDLTVQVGARQRDFTVVAVR